jgi:hypothetical protein
VIGRRPIAYLIICAALLAGLGPTFAGGEPDWAEPPGEPDPGAAARQAFARFCATCHAGPGAAPVNFLNPAAGSRADAIAQCAERIAFRLAIWDWPEALRPQPPMPPPMPPADWLQGQGIDADKWAAGDARATLGVYIAGLLALTGSSTVRVEQTGSLDYERLRPCLAEEAP